MEAEHTFLVFDLTYMVGNLLKRLLLDNITIMKICNDRVGDQHRAKQKDTEQQVEELFVDIVDDGYKFLKTCGVLLFILIFHGFFLA